MEGDELAATEGLLENSGHEINVRPVSMLYFPPKQARSKWRIGLTSVMALPRQ